MIGCPKINRTGVEDAIVSVQALRVALGRADAIDEFQGLGAEEMVDFATRHRIVGRLIKATEQKNISFQPDVLEALMKKQAHVTKEFQSRQAVLNRFIRTFCKDMNVLLYKYNTSYFYSGDSYFLRPFGDFDLAVDKPSTLKSRLIEQKIDVSRNRYPPHEFLNAVFEGMPIDLHRYLPLWERVDFYSMPNSFSPNVSCFGSRAIERGIPPIESIESGHQIDSQDGHFYIPYVTHSALFLIAATYRDFVTHAAPHLYNQPEVRISDICETLDLLLHSDFDKSDFKSVVQIYGLAEAIDWFSGMILDLLGDHSLAELGFDKSRFSREKIGRQSIQRSVAGGFWLLRIPEHPAGHSDNIRPPKPGYPATLV